MKGAHLKAPVFDYRLARSPEEAFDLLSGTEGDARVLAGGQSLIASLNLRLSSPDLLVDIGRIAAWKGIRRTERGLRIGALTTHAEIEHSPLVARTTPLLAAAAPFIAHPGIRNGGTIGGSACLADPAAEWPACLVALRADMIVESAAGRRAVPSQSFFRDVYETALAPGEILTAIEVPEREPDEVHVFDEFARRPGDFAMAGLALAARFDGVRIAALKLGFLGLGSTPLAAERFAASCVGLTVVEAGASAAEALAEELGPVADHHASAEYRLRLAEVLTRRLLARAAERAKTA
jgi:carbon-monoxide dehydrogenase medium subunit